MAPYNLAYIDNKKVKERVEIITNQSIKNLLGVFTANLSVINCDQLRAQTNTNSVNFSTQIRAQSFLINYMQKNLNLPSGQLSSANRSNLVFSGFNGFTLSTNYIAAEGFVNDIQNFGLTTISNCFNITFD